MQNESFGTTFTELQTTYFNVLFQMLQQNKILTEY